MVLRALGALRTQDAASKDGYTLSKGSARGRGRTSGRTAMAAQHASRWGDGILAAAERVYPRSTSETREPEACLTASSAIALGLLRERRVRPEACGLAEDGRRLRQRLSKT